jgi:hypothetical protein
MILFNACTNRLGATPKRVVDEIPLLPITPVLEIKVVDWLREPVGGIGVNVRLRDIPNAFWLGSTFSICSQQENGQNRSR